jgi:hypothetical protein
MSSTFSSTRWLPDALVRAAIVPNANARPSGPRHLAAEDTEAITIATPEDLARTGRHAEKEWSRALHDPERDEVDPFAWLGFADPVGA